VVTAQMEARLQKPQWYIPLATLCCLLWASAFPAIKLGYRFFAIAAANPPYAQQAAAKRGKGGAAPALP